jgi:hypothetical protein
MHGTRESPTMAARSRSNTGLIMVGADACVKRPLRASRAPARLWILSMAPQEGRIEVNYMRHAYCSLTSS